MDTKDSIEYATISLGKGKCVASLKLSSLYRLTVSNKPDFKENYIRYIFSFIPYYLYMNLFSIS